MAQSERPVVRFNIIGAGIAGLSVAISLRRSGHEVTVFERTPKIQPVGAGIGVSPNATLVIKDWGILPELRAVSMQPKEAVFHSYHGQELHRGPMGEYLETTYKSPYLSVHRADLHKVLLDEATRLGTKIRLNSQITKIDTKSKIPSLTLSTGEVFESDVLIGADGQRSATRACMLNREDGDPPIDSGDEILRIIVPTARVLAHPDLKHLVDPPNFNLWAGPDSMAMVYPLKKEGLFNIVMARAHKQGKGHKIVLGAQDIGVEEVREMFKDGWDEKFRTLLGMAQECQKWTMLKGQDLYTWLNEEGSVCLVGDASHAIGPFLGQGAALAFEDAAALGVLFTKISSKSQIPDILTIFERMRRDRAGELLRRSERYRNILMMKDGPKQEERDRQLREIQPFEGFANFVADPVLTKWLYSYNALEEAEKAWQVYLRGQCPETRGVKNALEETEKAWQVYLRGG